MKKLLFGLIAIVMFTSVSFGQNEIKLSDYGFYHNELLNMYFNNYKLNEEVSIDTFIDNSLLLAKKKYPGKFDNVDVKKLKSVFEGQTIKEFDYFKIWNNRKEQMLSQKLVSPSIIQFVDEVNTGKYTIDEVLNMIAKLQSSKTITKNDSDALIVAKSVVFASHSYWTSNGTNTTNKVTTKDLADFGAALMFFESGPLSICAGFACSALF